MATDAENKEVKAPKMTEKKIGHGGHACTTSGYSAPFAC